tara:strand:- start:96 stop:500 length:405 start_codon:yes stop_codon:yes gene_type:complete
MNEKLFSLLSGIIFGVGLVISGMTNPEKVIGFLSIANNWDASLMFVMGGAIIITAPFFYFLKDRHKSSLGLEINLPQKKDLNTKLIIGSSLFGIGWGLVGLCPGPAVSSLALFEPITVIFLFSMLIGVFVNKYI